MSAFYNFRVSFLSRGARISFLLVIVMRLSRDPEDLTYYLARQNTVLLALEGSDIASLRDAIFLPPETSGGIYTSSRSRRDGFPL